jgi:Tfp pilus assembly PilM family ATPase
MPKKIAVDWDEAELRMVAAQCSGTSVKVTHVAVVPIANANVNETLRGLIQKHQLGNTETLVAIGRGQAEIRELQLPPAPHEELPDMVRFQAIRSFASAGDSATIDYLVTKHEADGVNVIAAAIGPAMLKEIHEIGQSAQLTTKRISIRPLAAAALYQIHHKVSAGDVVLIDLLANDAEIVVLRAGRVVFVRTVRMPTDESTRAKALAAELRRSLMACGSTGSLDRVVLWGRAAVHENDREMLKVAANSPVDTINPFDLVEVGSEVKSQLPDHVGRLAPLVGLLAADETQADRLIDFLNPRKRVEEKPNPYRKALLIGLPTAAALLIAFLGYRFLQAKDAEIANLKAELEKMKPDLAQATISIQRTETVDEFLDGNVNWLHEMKRLAERMPPADRMILKSLTASLNPRGGGGILKVQGAVTSPAVIEDFEDALRDESHQVAGDGASSLKTEDSYRLGFNESIVIDGASIRNERYAAINALLQAEAAGGGTASTVEAVAPPPDTPPENAAESTAESTAENTAENAPESGAENAAEQASAPLPITPAEPLTEENQPPAPEPTPTLFAEPPAGEAANAEVVQ